MAETTSETVKLRMRLLIDEEKNKVVLAETGKDFVDVLFSLLTLPMGTIVRLLEKHRKSSPGVVIGCFNNLYKSVSEMGLESFQTEACKQVLLSPRSVNIDKYSKLKLKIDDTAPVKYFVCSRLGGRKLCGKYYSLSNTEKCDCKEDVDSILVNRSMNCEIRGLEEEKVKGRVFRYDNDGVFVKCKASSFIITDDLKVALNSMDYVLNTLRGLGYESSRKHGEMLLDVGLNEVLSLMECLFTSDTPLTDTFLRKQSSLRVTRSLVSLTASVQESGQGPDQTITLKAFVRKLDSKILCVECGSDFVDLLFTFLALPLESVFEISGGSITMGCIGNLVTSFKSMKEETDASKCLLPSYYSCPKTLLDVVTEQEQIYFSRGTYDCKFTRENPQGGNNMIMSSNDTKVHTLYMTSFGFVRDNTRYLVTDDLVIKHKNSVSNISLLKLQIHLEEKDVKQQVITIGKQEAISLLRASLMTSTALTTCLWNFIEKNPKEET